MAELLPSSARKIYLDTNIFIYFIEDRGRYGEAAADLMTQLADRGIPHISSQMAYAESLHGAVRQGNAALAEVYRELFHDPASAFLRPVTKDILESAASLAAELGMKLIDAIHVAMALAEDCDTFLTNDNGIRTPGSMSKILFSTLLPAG